MAWTAWIGTWARSSNARAVANARLACTTLSRQRVEREEVDLFLRERSARVDGSRAG